jgi:hypothetical protein
MKKILIIAVLTIIAMIIPVQAIEYPDVEGTKYEEAVEFLSAYGIVGGFPDGTFRPEEPVTRAQVAKMATIALGYESFSRTVESTFYDMEGHWATRFVDIAASFDIVQGYLDGNFGPDNNVTYSEAVTMVLRTLGYTDASLPGAWPYDYFIKAGDLGIVKNIPITADNATRGDLALMLFNAMLSEKGTVDRGSNVWESKGELLLANIGYKEEKTIGENDIAEARLYPQLSRYRYYTGDLFYNSEGEIVYFINTKTEYFQGTVTGITGTVLIVEDKNGNRKPFDVSGAKIVFNGAEGNLSSLLGSNANVIFENTAIYKNKVTAVTASKVTRHILASSTYSGEALFNGIYLPLTNGRIDPEKINIYGAAANLSEIKINDLLYVYETDEANYRKSHLEIYVVRNNIQGTMTETGANSSVGYSVIDGKTYRHSDIYMPISSLSPGYYVEAYLDAFGHVVKYKLIRDVKQPDTYGLVLGVTSGDNVTLPKIRLLDNKGVERTYSVRQEVLTPVSLVQGDIIKYSLDTSNVMTRLAKSQTQSYNGSFSYGSGYLPDTNAYINASTIIYYKSGTRWIIISSDRLDEFIKGKIVKNTAGNIAEVIVLDSGFKSTYPDTVNGAILEVSTVQDGEKNTVYKFRAYINGRIAEVYSSPDYNESLKGIEKYKGQFINLEMLQSKVKGYSLPRMELDFTAISKIYDNNLLKVDSTFYEYSNDLIIYGAEKTDTGYTITKVLTKSDVEEGDSVRLYDVKGSYDGVIDTIILIKK